MMATADIYYEYKIWFYGISQRQILAVKSTVIYSGQT